MLNPFHIQGGCKNIAFIDVGAGCGDVLMGFFMFHNVLFRTGKVKLHVHAFEPVPAQHGAPHLLRKPTNRIKKVVSKHGGTTALLDKAAWTYDGKLKFRVGKKFTASDSMVSPISELAKVSSCRFRRDTLVDCIDFSKWLEELVEAEEYDKVYVKMSIQGSEYAVLNKMIKDKTLAHVDKLFVEFNKIYPHVDKQVTEERCVQNIYANFQNIEIYTESGASWFRSADIGIRYEYIPRFDWANRTKMRPFIVESR